MRRILQPDGFTIGLFLFGAIMLLVPMMIVPGIVAMLSALAYWVTMMIVKLFTRRQP